MLNLESASLDPTKQSWYLLSELSWTSYLTIGTVYSSTRSPLLSRYIHAQLLWVLAASRAELLPVHKSPRRADFPRELQSCHFFTPFFLNVGPIVGCNRLQSSLRVRLKLSPARTMCSRSFFSLFCPAFLKTLLLQVHFQNITDQEPLTQAPLGNLP